MAMQLTIELPEDLARELGSHRDDLPAIIRRGLRLVGRASATQEIFEFLAGRPSPAELLAYQPPEASVNRLRELLARNRENGLSPAEEAELDTLESLNELFTLLKIQARHELKSAA